MNTVDLPSGFQEDDLLEEDHALSELLFELSSTDRLRLLFIGRSDQLRLSQLAKKTAASVQETARHLERLTAARLVEKNARGEYLLTSMGKLCLDQFSSLRFAAKYRSYILEHDFSFLPEEFLHRLGELLTSELADNVSDILHHTETVMREGKEYVFLMADQALVPSYSAEVPHPNPDGMVSWKSIIPYSVFANLPELKAIPKNIEVRFLNSPKVAIAMNEKLAGVCFPDLKGKLDMSSGLRGKGASMHKWCHDLFMYCWEEAESPRRNL